MSERDVRAEIVAYLRTQAEIHRSVGNDSWWQCLSGYATLIEQRPENDRFIAELLAKHGVVL